MLPNSEKIKQLKLSGKFSKQLQYDITAWDSIRTLVVFRNNCVNMYPDFDVINYNNVINHMLSMVVLNETLDGPNLLLSISGARLFNGV